MSTNNDRRYVEIANLTKAYPNPYGEAVRVVDEFNLILRQGEVVSIIGHSGCGKSTVLTMVAGLNDITSGAVVVAGREISGPGPDRAVVFQAPCLLPWMTAFQNVMLGGILVGDASAYNSLSIFAKSGAPLPCAPHELILGSSKGSSAMGGIDALPDSAQVCSCNNVTKAAICTAIAGQNLESVAAVKSGTRAGTGCGGCMPLVTDLFHAQMKAAGKVVNHHLCEHFAYSRTELLPLSRRSN